MRAASDPDRAGRPPRFASAALGTMGVQLAIAVLGFANVLLVARTLGPSARGDVALLTTISMLTSTLALLGIDEANVNIAGREPGSRRALATNTVVLSALLGLGALAVLIPLLEAVPALGGNAPSGLRWLALALIPVLILKVALKFLLQADYHFGAVNLAWLLPPLVSVSVNAVLAAFGRLTVTSAFSTWAAAHILATALLVVFVALRSVGFGRPDPSLARRTIGFGARSHLGRAMMAGNYRADQWFVGSIAGSRELGLYSVAVAWSEVLLYLPTVLVIVQRPYLVRAERAEAGRRAAQIFRAGLVVTGVAVVAVVALAPVLCAVVFGAAFAGSVDDLRVLAAGAVGILALKLLGNAVTAQGRPGLATAGATAAFAVTLSLDIVLVPELGGLGAAIASASAYTVGGAATALIFLRFFGARPGRLAPRPADLAHLARQVGDRLAARGGASPSRPQGAADGGG